MTFDFTSIVDRHGKDSIAVDAFGRPGFGPTEEAKARNEEAKKRGEGFDLIPMWVADMNFATCPAVVRSIRERLDHPMFGYFAPRDEYYESIIRWQKERHGVAGLTKEDIGFENGVLGGVISALRVIAEQGGKVLLHSPVYVGFTGVLKNNGYEAVHSPLVRDENGVWRMDFEDMEKKLSEGHIHAAIFCSPHNPCGRVWEKWEIERAMALFEKYEVDVVSDEIWADIILEGHTHIPTQSVSAYARAHTVAEYAITKTFNLAGLTGSYHIIYDPKLRDRVRKASSLTHYNSMHLFSMYALIGAYSEEGSRWTDELISVLSNNVRTACAYIDRFDGVRVMQAEGTYMLYLDCTEFCQKYKISMDELLQKGYDVYVAWQDGRPFFHPYAIRMNLALPESRIKQAFERLSTFVFNHS